MRIALLAVINIAAFAQPFRPEIPKTWDEEALHTMELPLATAGASPVHISAERYYAIPPITIYKTYPPSMAGKTDEEYRAWLLEQDPELIRFDAESLRTREDWIRAGGYVFEAAREYSETLTPRGRMVIRSRGKVEYTLGASCASCHTRVMEDGIRISGAQMNLPRFWRGQRPVSRQTFDNLRGLMVTDFATPWLEPDPNGALAKASDETLTPLLTRRPAPTFRFGTSPLSPANMPDLIGIQDLRYLDRTGLVQHRGIGDLMRYAALDLDPGTVGNLSSYGGFVPNEHRTPARVPFRFSDEQLYSLALYIYSLEPPKNPNPFDEIAARGEKVFQTQGCGECHPAPLYTNNKLTPAPGFRIPGDHKAKYDIMPVSVGTDPWLAMKTRRGTGYYKVPSLRGVWYRGPFEHNGSVVTLEDWLDPNRLRDDYVPTGWPGPNATRAVKGHEFGLRLQPEEKKALIAFLKTL